MACNTGVSWTPIINDKRYTFTYAGLYNGFSLLRDLETSSTWHHITGECLDGPLAGEALGDDYPLQYLTVAETVKRYPRAIFPVENTLNWWQHLLVDICRYTLWADSNATAMVAPFLRPFMKQPDGRLPLLEVGLGVSHKDKARFYSLNTLKEAGHAVIDTLDGERMILFIDPYSSSPFAVCTPAKTFKWENNTIVLDNGTKIEHGSLKSIDGSVTKLSYPRQVFTRWYGFSHTYPDCDVFTLDDAVDDKVDAKVDAKVDDKVDAKVAVKTAAK